MASVLLLQLYNRSSDHAVGPRVRAVTLILRRYIGFSSEYRRNFSRVVEKKDFKLEKVPKILETKPGVRSCLDKWDEADGLEYDQVDWKDVALIFDRLGLLVCSATIGTMTVLLFALLTAQP